MARLLHMQKCPPRVVAEFGLGTTAHCRLHFGVSPVQVAFVYATGFYWIHNRLDLELPGHSPRAEGDMIKDRHPLHHVCRSAAGLKGWPEPCLAWEQHVQPGCSPEFKSMVTMRLDPSSKNEGEPSSKDALVIVVLAQNLGNLRSYGLSAYYEPVRAWRLHFS